MRQLIVIVLAFGLLIAADSCKDRYDPGIQTPVTGFLVVEGFINSGIGNTEIRLSRTVQLEDSSNVKRETGANVLVEGDDGSSYLLGEIAPGTYRGDSLRLNKSHQYRLHIYTSGQEYQSAFAKVVATPPIDSMPYFRAEVDGVHISVNAFDPTKSTQYYTWRWEDTYEIVSQYAVFLRYLYDAQSQLTGVDFLNPVGLPDTTNMRCWKTQYSTQILTASTLKLSADRLDKEIMFIPNGSPKLDKLYSLKLYMHGCSAEGYDFLQRMSKNNEQLGSIFDAQPSELNSNIVCLSNPQEKVIGFVDVADGHEQRIFISKQDVGGWNYRPNCEKLIKPNLLDTLEVYQYFYAPLYYEDPFKSQVAIGTKECSYCTLLGTNVKPPFWPN